MMNKCLILVFGLAVLLLVNACDKSDEYNVPEVLVPAVNPDLLGAKTTFTAVVSRYEAALGEGDKVGTWEFDAPLYIEGYVVSSDVSGNFFEELMIQNTTDKNDLENDIRQGFKIDIKVRDLANFYNYGRKVYIKLNGLAITKANGVLTLGRAKGKTMQQLEAFEYKEFIIRAPEVANITPKTVAIEDLTAQDINTLVEIEGVQFVKSALQNTNTYAGQVSDSFDGFRTIENCDTGFAITLQTSTFSDFKLVPLAAGKGTVTGIYTRDFRDKLNVLIINDTKAVKFDSPERCDPEVLECNNEMLNDVVVFTEDFQSITNEPQLDALGWTNINVSGGKERFEDNSFAGEVYLKVSAFGTNENPMEAWLVTPAINLDSTTNETLSFDISTNFETGLILTAYATTNFTGDVTTTNWIELEANIPIGNDSYGDFINSKINVSCLSGDVHVAFKYLGIAGAAETRYHIDNIKVTGAN